MDILLPRTAGLLPFSGAGRAFFRELDGDGDGRVSADDVKKALRARNLPGKRAHDFISAARGGRWWMQKIGCLPLLPGRPERHFSCRGAKCFATYLAPSVIGSAPCFART